MHRTIAATVDTDQLVTGIAQLDVNLRVTYVNPAFAERTCLGAGRILGCTLAHLPPDGHRLHAMALRSQAEHAACSLHGIVVRAAPDQETRLDFTFSPLATGVLVEVHPSLPTADAGQVAQSLRGFAHEVRNPLAAISGAAQLLQQQPDANRQRELARLIQREAERLAELAGRLLGRRNAMALRTVNVHMLLEHVAELLRAERVDVAVTRDYDPSLPVWQGDPDRLLQALINLTRNALEAHASRIVLRSRAEAGWRDAHGQRVAALRIEVEDNGDGIADAIAATLFEPMVSGRANGTGLGLALAREIAREHGGELSLQRTPVGSRFVLQLPHQSGKATTPTQRGASNPMDAAQGDQQ